VSRGEVEAFKRNVRDLLDRYKAVLTELENDAAVRANVAAETLAGRGREIALEAHVRLYLLDPILRELGWDVQTPANIVVEDGVEPVPGGPDKNRRRLDYHGRDATERRSLLAVEAKRPSVRLPDTAGGPLDQWIAYALRLINCNDPAAAQLPAGWKEILDTAIDYVKRVRATYGDLPTRFALTNGEWFVVFSDLNTTILAREPVVERIRVFVDLADVTANADEFWELLGYRPLSGYIPPQDPGSLPHFIPDGQEGVCARVVDISYVRHGERQPLISVRVGAWVRTPNGAWILFQKNYPKQFLVLSDDSDELVTRRQELTERADTLLAELRNHRPVRFATLDEYDPPPPVGAGLDNGAPRRALVRDLGRGEHGVDRYQVVTVEQVLYFNDTDGYDSCRYHGWGPCSAEGNAVGAAPITAPASEPRCFFPSGSPLHCSHSAIQAHRTVVCLLQAFEERLCCQKCVFLRRCWSGIAMPCRQD
jgi:hypothetical protein